MDTKFTEEFKRITDGAYPMLKLNGATYDKKNNLLTVRFIISAFEIQNFNDDKREDVLNAVKNLFPGIGVDVQYIRTYADKSVVKNKILEFFNNSNQMLFANLDNEDNLSITVDSEDIIIAVKLKSPLMMMFNAGDIKDNLINMLDRAFNYNIVLSAEEIPDDEEDSELGFVFDTKSTSVIGDLRLIDVETGRKVYSKGKINGISQLPNYIIDIKNESDSAVLCGKVSNVSRRTYKNKKYNPDDAKSGPEELPMIRFMLDDSTGKMDTVCFPRPDDADTVEQMLNGTYAEDENGSDSANVNRTKDGCVICSGRVSKFRDALSFTANSVFECEINFDSIHLTSVKPVPDRYTEVFPKNVVSMHQQSLIDGDKPTVNPYFENKTFVIYDLETTDRYPESAHVIQIAALKVVDGVEKQTFETFVKPPIAIPDEITELTHIGESDVENAPTIEQVMPDFFKFTRGAILVGHNLC